MYHLSAEDFSTYTRCIKKSFCCLSDKFLETQIINFAGGRVCANAKLVSRQETLKRCCAGNYLELEDAGG